MNRDDPFVHLSFAKCTSPSQALARLSCGDDAGGPTVDSQLLGIYRITSYQGSAVGCEQPSEFDPAPAFVLLYSFLPNDDPDEPLLGGIFCGTVESCRQAAQAASEPRIGYSFLEGNDAAGWRGWAIASAGAANDQCRADVQAHVLTSANMNDINIETKTFQTVFDGLDRCREAPSSSAATSMPSTR